MTFTEAAELYRSVGKSKKCTFIFCADHGVAKENVSAYPQKTTADMVKNYLIDAGAAANVFAKFAYSELYVVDVGVDADISHLPGLVDRKIARGTKNIAEGPAMTVDEAMESVRVGKKLAEEAIASGCNCFLIGEMGIGNTTVAAAMTAAFLNLSPKEVTGRGSNIDDKKFKHKLEIVWQALQTNGPNRKILLDVLTKVGGFEFGAMAGVIIAAYHHNCVVMLDGFNSSVAALVAEDILPRSKECLIASHVGREVGHRAILNHLGLKPIFNLDLALGEAVGASIAARILDNLVYIFVCGPDADFDGELETEKDEALETLKKQLGIDGLDGLNSIEDIQELFGDEVQIEEIPLDFHVSEHRMESIELPFSTQTLNIPRNYPIAARVMGDDNDELIAATDRTFNFYLQTMPRLHDRPMNNCREILDSLTKPKGSLGYLEEIAVQVAGIANEDQPTNKLRHAALAFTNFENCPALTDPNYNPKAKGVRRDLSMEFSATARTFGMKIFLGVVNPEENLNVAFNFGRNLAEEISFDTPIIALTDLSHLLIDRLANTFSDALLTADGKLKYPPEEFLQHVPKNYQCMTSSIIGAIVAAAHNSTLIVVDTGAIDIITRYLEKICPAVRPFILHSAQLIEYKAKEGNPLGFDGEAACMGVEIVEAALVALNEMKTFEDTGVEKAIRN